MVNLTTPHKTFMFNNTRVNIYNADEGEGLSKHTHAYSHLTVCISGKCAIRKENIYLEIDKNSDPLLLKEQEWHEIEALEDNTIFSNMFVEGF